MSQIQKPKNEPSKSPDELILLANKVSLALREDKSNDWIDKNILSDCNEMDNHLICCWLMFTDLLTGLQGLFLKAFLMSKGQTDKEKIIHLKKRTETMTVCGESGADAKSTVFIPDANCLKCLFVVGRKTQ